MKAELHLRLARVKAVVESYEEVLDLAGKPPTGHDFTKLVSHLKHVLGGGQVPILLVHEVGK